jgi:hypothetical protein
MNEFFVYCQLGFEHIADIKGYDHILFVSALAAPYAARDWRRLLWLVTAFTLGHSVTLALSTLNILTIAPALIEFLIPVTILLTCVANVVNATRGAARDTTTGVSFRLAYLTAAVFGLIHGLGFSNYLKGLLGRDQNIVAQLLAFNLGLEGGQILILSVVLSLAWLAQRFTPLSRRDWTLLLSGAAGGVAMTLMLARV